MHWLIPLVSHTLSSLLAWLADTITPAGVLVSCGLVAAQSFHLWTGFYGLFAVFFLGGTIVAAGHRLLNSKHNSPFGIRSKRTAAYALANVLIAAVLVPLHQYYMKKRLVTVPWYHSYRAPAGCLPVPSRLLKESDRYDFFPDALANQIPYGVVVSYAVGLGNTFVTALAGRGNSGSSLGKTVLFGATGAAMIAIAAASTMPLCAGNENGEEYVAMHLDRSVAWEERTAMTWLQGARIAFVALVTIAGAVGAIIIDRMAGYGAQPSATRAQPVRGVEKPSMAKAKEAKRQEKVKGDITSEMISPGDVASFCSNVILTGNVILAMAIWSYVPVE